MRSAAIVPVRDRVGKRPQPGSDRAVSEACRICGNRSGNQGFIATEMMLGLRDRFDYLECGRCGALQIREIPTDLSRYYAPPYYSFQPARPAAPVKRWLRRRLADHALGQRSVAGSLGRARPGEAPAGDPRRRPGSGRAHPGCGRGAGQTLLLFHDYGFRHLLGVDPYLPGDLRYEPASKSGARPSRRYGVASTWSCSTIPSSTWPTPGPPWPRHGSGSRRGGGSSSGCRWPRTAGAATAPTGSSSTRLATSTSTPWRACGP
jgi:hypothetical protein